MENEAVMIRLYTILHNYDFNLKKMKKGSGMKITSYLTQALIFTFVLSNFSPVELFAAPAKKDTNEQSSITLVPKKLSKSDLDLVNQLEAIQKSLSRKLTGLNAIKTTALSTPELSEKDTQAYNYAVLIRNELINKPVIAHTLIQELNHVDNHIRNVNVMLDDIQNSNPDDRTMYVKLYKWSVPIMFNLQRDLTIKAIKVIKFGTLRQASSGS